MDIKEAIHTAKATVSDLFTGEGARDFTLEEVELRDRVWRVTVGFARPTPIYNNATDPDFIAPMRRAFKVVELSDENSSLLAVRDRARTS